VPHPCRALSDKVGILNFVDVEFACVQSKTQNPAASIRAPTISALLIRLHEWMNDAASARYLTLDRMAREQDQHISEVVQREQSRLRNFIRRRVPDPGDAEDILQDVFYRLVEANRLLMPIEHVTGWLFRVARNRITDLFRKKEPENFSDLNAVDEEGELASFEDLLPSPDAGPEAAFVRNVLLDELEAALDELPEDQREVFEAHEFEGRSFKDMAEEMGVSINTLLARKRYAVLHLRERLQRAFQEFLKR
jgi:RNA polymerase sigma factor (sigma-70 family)